MTEAALTPGTRADCGTDGQVRPAQVSRTPGSSSPLPVSEREDSLFSNGSITGFYCEGAIARHLILEEMQYLYCYHNRIYTCTTAVFILVQL